MKIQLWILLFLPFLLISCGDTVKNDADDKMSSHNSFDYLQAANRKILNSIQLAKSELPDGNKAIAKENLENAEEYVQFLISDQLPLINVRKLIYDSWRLYINGRVEETNRLFDEAEQFLEKIKKNGQQSQTPVIKEIQDLLIDVRATIKKTRYSISNKYQLEDPSSVAAKFYLLTVKINEIVFSNENSFSSKNFESQ